MDVVWLDCGVCCLFVCLFVRRLCEEVYDLCLFCRVGFHESSLVLFPH